MEPENTTTPAAKPRQRLTLPRLLLGFAGLCLFVWSIKTIHHALQPKYQGKTAQEWFASIDTHDPLRTGVSMATSLEDPAILALEQLGPSATKLLWRELHVHDSKLKTLFIEKARAWTDSRWLIEPGSSRNFKALVAIQQMGVKADSLVPHLLLCAQSSDQQECHHGLHLLGAIGTRPEVTVPLFLSNIATTNQMIFGQSMQGLQKLGPQASNALPALAQALTLKTNHERLLIASAMVAIGDRTKLSVLLSEAQNIHSPYRTNTLNLLQRLKTNAVAAVPDLITLAKNSTNDYPMQLFTAQTIDLISPGAAKAAGLYP